MLLKKGTTSRENCLSHSLLAAVVSPAMSEADEPALLARLDALLGDGVCVAGAHPSHPTHFSTSQLLLLLLHPSDAVRARCAQLLVQQLRLADAPRAEVLRRWAPASVDEWRLPSPPLLPPPPAQPITDAKKPLADERHGQRADASAASYASVAVSSEISSEISSQMTIAFARSTSLARTEHSVRTLRTLGLALSTERPTLLLGPAGSGKSCLLAALARAQGDEPQVGNRMVTQTVSQMKRKMNFTIRQLLL